MVGSFANRSRELGMEIRSLYYRARDIRNHDLHLAFRNLRAIRSKLDTNVASLQRQIDRIAHPSVKPFSTRAPPTRVPTTPHGKTDLHLLVLRKLNRLQKEVDTTYRNYKDLGS